MTTRVIFLAFIAAKLYWNVRPSVDGALVNIVLGGSVG